MKKKLFFLLVACVALVGFNAKAQTAPPKYTVGIQTGDSLPVLDGQGKDEPFSNERAGYASKVMVKNKLTLEGGAFKYKEGDPKPEDKFIVQNVNDNFIQFRFKDPDKLLTVEYSVTKEVFDKFVVFRAVASPDENDEFYHVPNYYAPNVATSVANTGQVLQQQKFDTNGYVEGFLGINATGMVDNGDLLIVVHNKAGLLSVMSYRAYVESLKSNLTLATNEFFPLYIKTKVITGRWATPADFKDCKFISFVSESGKKIQAYDARELASGRTADLQKGIPNSAAKPVEPIFTVKQVDYVQNQDVANTHNLITWTGGATFEGLDADTDAGKFSTYFGTYNFDSELSVAKADAAGDASLLVPGSTDFVIPLFVLASPDDGCKVLSISRFNQNGLQTQGFGGIANMLELREYGEYYGLNTAGTAWNWYNSMNDATGRRPAGMLRQEWIDTYTSLQKFAIWITEEGEYKLYPAASYFWEYGLPKPEQLDQIFPNSVLKYNNINVQQNSLLTSPEDKSRGFQVGYWNHTLHQSSIYPNPWSYMGTAPNRIFKDTEYSDVIFERDNKCSGQSLEGRFYFLEVWNYKPPVPAALTGNSTQAEREYYAALGTAGYQLGHEYVLSTQVNENQEKILVVVPKEKVMADPTDYQYWRVPYDSVNMAAHWRIDAVAGGGYRFVNMLGDTLQYNIPGAAPNYQLSGGYLPVNRLMPGWHPFNQDYPSLTDNAVNGTYEADQKGYLLGRPTDNHKNWSNVTTWFNFNTLPYGTTTYNVWNAVSMEGDEGDENGAKFFLELKTRAGDGLDNVSINLSPDLTMGLSGWYKSALSTIGAPIKNVYYQQRLQLEMNDLSVLESNPAEVSACPGLMFKRVPISYVPKYADVFENEVKNEIYNTNDPTFAYRDSLTAYTFLEGKLDIVEAKDVENKAKLGFSTILTYDGNKKVDAARFVTTEDKNIVQFIPLSDPSVADRYAQIRAATGNDDTAIDTLYNETYKWYLVKHVKTGKYLRFDTINVAAGTNREKVGFVFGGYTGLTLADSTDIIANATPVRLYQPLVGDKEKTNFLIQFYLPKYTYHKRTTGTNVFGKFANSFPNISDDYDRAPINGGGQVCFAKLSDAQTYYIVGTRAYTDAEPTRFTFDRFRDPDPDDCDCTGTFILPTWMAEHRLLSLPLHNQLFKSKDLSEPLNSFIAIGKVPADKPEGPNVNEAILNIGEGASGTTLKHTYVTTIHEFNNAAKAYPATHPLSVYNGKGTNGVGSVFIPYKLGDYSYPATANYTYISGFAKDLDVPLYYVQNEDGYYLTVVPLTDMKNGQEVTDNDVNGVKLQWKKEAYVFDATEYGKLGYDKRVFQLFAIHGCMEEEVPASKKYGNWIYLPLSSYVVDYSKGQINKIKVGTNDVYENRYNTFLGTGAAAKPNCLNNEVNDDIRDCFRISQFSKEDDVTKHLVVFNSSSQVVGGNLIPVEIKVWKDAYAKIDVCDNSFMVQNPTTKKYYTYDNPAKTIEDVFLNYSLDAHWSLGPWDTKFDEDMPLASFVPELKTVYGEDNLVNQTVLTGKYLVIDQKAVGDDLQVVLMNFDPAKYNGYRPFVEENVTFLLKCAEHDVPFFDLEADGNFDLSKQLAIVEYQFINRVLGYSVDKVLGLTPVNAAGAPTTVAAQIAGYRCYIDNMEECDFTDVPEYVNVYRVYERQLIPEKPGNHMIPYYAFSISKGDAEFFLNVNTAFDYKITWMKMKDADAQRKLLLPANETEAQDFANYKFCLPYKWEKAKDGSWKIFEVSCKPDLTAPIPAVYLQTLDTKAQQDPYLLISSTVTKYVDANKLSFVVDKQTNPTIYNVDYTLVNELKANAWVFGGVGENTNLWVPLRGVFDKENNKAGEYSLLGHITDFNVTGIEEENTGVTFIAKGYNETLYPDFNIGILTGTNAPDLKIEFEGDTVIGELAVRPIWYYRINSGDEYLTDGREEQTFTFKGQPYSLAYFADREPDFKAYKDEGIFADKDFTQTFGFRYLKDDKDPKQVFYIVSNANYKNSKKPGLEAGYRYLSQAGNHLIFVDSKEDALVFQWGKIEDGTYTDIQVVGKGGIFGVPGGVKLLDATGKVDIYSIDGRLIKSAIVTGAEQTISVPRGIAIVKNGNKVVKVIVQ